MWNNASDKLPEQLYDVLIRTKDGFYFKAYLTDFIEGMIFKENTPKELYWSTFGTHDGRTELDEVESWLDYQSLYNYYKLHYMNE